MQLDNGEWRQLGSRSMAGPVWGGSRHSAQDALCYMCAKWTLVPTIGGVHVEAAHTR